MDEMTERQAQRLIEWVTGQGFTRERANEALAYVMGADEKPQGEKKSPQAKKKGSQTTGK